MLSIKYISLLVLAVQNSALILTMRYSRTIPGPKYNPTTTVLLSEVIKTVLSMSILLYTRWRARTKSASDTSEAGSSRSLLGECLDDIFQLNAIIPIMIPAILYTVQNNLQYLAASNLDSATFQALYQGKILTTAFFAILILRQKLTLVKWSGIIVLTLGIALVSCPSSESAAKSIRRALMVDARMIGLLAVLSACLLSGFAGVFLEFILKKAKNNTGPSGTSQLWVRNVQLSLISVGIASLAAAYVDGPQILHDGFFYGYSAVTWYTLLLQAVGGLIVALVITYADNILKNFATSLSLVFSTIISTMMGEIVLTERFITGVVLVVAATNIYGLSLERKKPQETSEDKDDLLVSDQDHHDVDTDSHYDESGAEADEHFQDEKYPLIRVQDTDAEANSASERESVQILRT